jgi:type I restriction enzyme M protein
MRKDVGVDGDAQRISQLVWMLFLKIFDDKESDLPKTSAKQRRLTPLNSANWPRHWACRWMS